jgi:2-oxo-3-hexenedioate decarboxylase
MDTDKHAEHLRAVAAEAFTALRHTRQVAPFSARSAGLSVEDAYRVMPLVRQMYEAEGARVVGRKIGFTNRTIWAQYDVYAPVWGYVFDRSTSDLAAIEALQLQPFSEPRIEPEIMFGLAAAPSAEMDEEALCGCIEWVALGFEIVQSIFEIELLCNGRVIDRGHSENVLGGPLSAFRHLVGLLAVDRVNPRLAAGEIVSTGTLTKAMPVAPGEVWTAAPSAIPLEPVRLRFI